MEGLGQAFAPLLQHYDLSVTLFQHPPMLLRQLGNRRLEYQHSVDEAAAACVLARLCRHRKEAKAKPLTRQIPSTCSAGSWPFFTLVCTA